MVEPTARFGVAIRNTGIPSDDTGILGVTRAEHGERGDPRPASVLPGVEPTELDDCVNCGPVPISHVCDWPLWWAS